MSPSITLNERELPWASALSHSVSKGPCKVMAIEQLSKGYIVLKVLALAVWEHFPLIRDQRKQK